MGLAFLLSKTSGINGLAFLFSKTSGIKGLAFQLTKTSSKKGLTFQLTVPYPHISITKQRNDGINMLAIHNNNTSNYRR